MAPPPTDTLVAPPDLPGGAGTTLLDPGKGRRGDSIFRGVALSAGLVVLAILALIAVFAMGAVGLVGNTILNVFWSAIAAASV